MSGPTIYLYEVSHPDYPTVMVPSIGRDSATMAAAELWGVRDQWGKIAGYCTVRKGGKAARPRCVRCDREFGVPGQAPGRCPDCQRAAERFRREMAGRGREDRRPGMRR